jgi:hypothetical protein
VRADSFSPEWPRFSLESDADLDLIPGAYVDADLGRMRCSGDRRAALVGAGRVLAAGGATCALRGCGRRLKLLRERQQLRAVVGRAAAPRRPRL